MKINFYNKVEKKFLNWIKDYSKKNNMDINDAIIKIYNEGLLHIFLSNRDDKINFFRKNKWEFNKIISNIFNKSKESPSEILQFFSRKDFLFLEKDNQSILVEYIFYNTIYEWKKQIEQSLRKDLNKNE